MHERALRMLAEAEPEHPTLMEPIRHVADILGMSPETLRLWQRRYEVGHGKLPGVTTDVAVTRYRKRHHADLQ
jgi:transposase